MSASTDEGGARIFLAVPFYQTFPGEAIANHDEDCVIPPDRYLPVRHGEAFVERNFSQCWRMALNSRKENRWTDFGMVHVDVQPRRPGWLSMLAAERRRVGADLLSVLLPIKTHHGITSTAVYDPATDRYRRLTMREAMGLPAVTFTAEEAGYPGCQLLASTGIWIADFTKPWVEEVWFETRCRIVRTAGGTFDVESFPEDWHFSRMLHARGLKVAATTFLECDHWGMAPYTNSRPWGTVATDEWHDSPPWLAGAPYPAVPAPTERE